MNGSSTDVLSDPMVLSLVIFGWLAIIGYVLNFLKIIWALITHQFNRVFLLRLIGLAVLPWGALMGLLVWGHSERDDG